MIQGHFDPRGRPQVRAYIAVPGRQPTFKPITLLLDTGADSTLRKTRLVYFRTELGIAMPDLTNRSLPSLLGRDIIDRCRILYDKAQVKLHLTPRLADGRTRL